MNNWIIYHNSYMTNFQAEGGEFVSWVAIFYHWNKYYLITLILLWSQLLWQNNIQLCIMRSTHSANTVLTIFHYLLIQKYFIFPLSAHFIIIPEIELQFRNFLCFIWRDPARVGLSFEKYHFLLLNDEGKILNNETETVYRIAALRQNLFFLCLSFNVHWRTAVGKIHPCYKMKCQIYYFNVIPHKYLI